MSYNTFGRYRYTMKDSTRRALDARPRMTDLQIAYMYTLVDVAKITRSLARSHAEQNDIAEMTAYLLANSPARCRCANDGDLCGRCETLELIRGTE